MGTTDTGNDARAIVIDWINHILTQKKWLGTDLARHAELAPSTVLRLLNDDKHRFIPSLKTLLKISSGSGYPIPNSITEALGAARVETQEDLQPRRRSTGAGQETRSRHMIDVRHVSALPAALHSANRAEITLPATIQLEGDETAFAFYMPDSTLDPWLKAGTLLYATKRRDPVPGDIVLVTDKTGRSRVRLLLQIDEQGIGLSESMPPKPDDAIGFDDLEDIAIVAVIAKI